MLTIAPAVPAHAVAIAPLLRPGDVEEIHLLCGYGAQLMLTQTLAKSSHSHVALDDGVPFCIGGVVPGSMLGREGMIWMMGTEGVARNRRWFLRHSRDHLATLFDAYDTLSNYVDARYVKSVRWLRWLGFEIGSPITFGPRNLQLLPFTMRHS